MNAILSSLSEYGTTDFGRVVEEGDRAAVVDSWCQVPKLPDELRMHNDVTAIEKCLRDLEASKELPPPYMQELIEGSSCITEGEWHKTFQPHHRGFPHSSDLKHETNDRNGVCLFSCFLKILELLIGHASMKNMRGRLSYGAKEKSGKERHERLATALMMLLNTRLDSMMRKNESFPGGVGGGSPQNVEQFIQMFYYSDVDSMMEAAGSEGKKRRCESGEWSTLEEMDEEEAQEEFEWYTKQNAGEPHIRAFNMLLMELQQAGVIPHVAIQYLSAKQYAKCEAQPISRPQVSHTWVDGETPLGVLCFTVLLTGNGKNWDTTAHYAMAEPPDVHLYRDSFSCIDSDTLNKLCEKYPNEPMFQWRLKSKKSGSMSRKQKAQTLKGIRSYPPKTRGT